MTKRAEELAKKACDPYPVNQNICDDIGRRALVEMALIQMRKETIEECAVFTETHVVPLHDNNIVMKSKMGTSESMKTMAQAIRNLDKSNT